MKYRQWKKNYKKLYGVNPPATIDKRKQRRLAKAGIKAIGAINWDKTLSAAAQSITDGVANFMRALGRGLDNAGTACKSAADNIQPIEIECGFNWEIKPIKCLYGVYENSTQFDIGDLMIMTHSIEAAKKIVEIMQQDQLEYYRRNYPERVQRGTDAADAILYGLRATKIYCDEGAFENA